MPAACEDNLRICDRSDIRGPRLVLVRVGVRREDPGQVDAIGGNTTYKMNLDKAAPGNDYEQKLVFNEQWMGVATPLGDAEINAWLNEFIDKIRADGRLAAINEKWLAAPMPDFPASIEGVPYTVQ